MAFVPGPSAPVPLGAVGFDVTAGLAILFGLVALGGGAVLASAVLERARAWCAARHGDGGLPASSPA